MARCDVTRIMSSCAVSCMASQGIVIYDMCLSCDIYTTIIIIAISTGTVKVSLWHHALFTPHRVAPRGARPAEVSAVKQQIQEARPDWVSVQPGARLLDAAPTPVGGADAASPRSPGARSAPVGGPASLFPLRCANGVIVWAGRPSRSRETCVCVCVSVSLSVSVSVSVSIVYACVCVCVCICVCVCVWTRAEDALKTVWVSAAKLVRHFPRLGHGDPSRLVGKGVRV